MENISQFDMNASLGLWLEKLTQSPHFRTENVSEMESHVRDSMTKLQSQGLSEEESFLIAIRRVGSVGKLEPEFAKVNRSSWNMIVHGLILVFLSIGCFLLWGLLSLPEPTARATPGMRLPSFTQLVVSWGSYLTVPPLLAVVDCGFVWVRKFTGKSSWIGFFATTIATLVLLTLPILYALLLFLIGYMQDQFVAK